MWLLKDNPPFTTMTRQEFGIVDLGNNATLNIDVENKSCSIILKKGGKGIMALKTVRQPYKGLETLFECICAERDNLEANKEAAKANAVVELDAQIAELEKQRQEKFDEVEKEFNETAERLEKAYLEASLEVEVEVPDEEPEAETEEIVEQE